MRVIHDDWMKIPSGLSNTRSKPLGDSQEVQDEPTFETLRLALPVVENTWNKEKELPLGKPAKVLFVYK
jgi:hypothetical protein